MKTVYLILIALFYVLISTTTISATDPSNLYVDVNQGNDSSDGSLDHPWSTINHAAEQVNPGDTVLIASGNYFITENIHITTSGNQIHPVTFKGLGSGVVIDGSGLDGSSYDKRDAIFVENANYIVIENLEIKNANRAGIRVSESDYVTIKNVTSHDNGRWGIFTGFSNNLLIENCECYGSKLEHGIYTSNSGDNPIIRGNIIHDNYCCGLHMNGDISMGGDGVISNALVEDNIIYNNGIGGGSGINCDGVRDSIIRNNLLYNNHASGISLYCIDGGAESNNNQVYHNTVIVASNGRWALNLKDGSSQNTIYNNILINNNPDHGSISADSIIGLESDYNIITTNSHPVTPDDDDTYPSFGQWQAMGFDQHSTQATVNQLFTNPSGNDYSLKKGSPAVDNGTPQHTYYRDILSNYRPQGNGCDMGAYEKVSNLIQPTDLVYKGAFRLPDVPGGVGWEYGGSAMTYYPGGDPGGPADEYPGSIFGTGHEWYDKVSEIAIPAPVISNSGDLSVLNTAETLQDFYDIRGTLFGDVEMPRMGLEYLPKQGEQTSDKLYFSWGQHMQEGSNGPTHAWCELNLSNPQTVGPWRIDDLVNYVTNDYIFAIPETWAANNTPGMLLATGRYRDGGQGAQGPSIIAYGPWNDGNPPGPGSTLSATPLLLYTPVTDPDNYTMNNYHHSDEWMGGAWLTSGDKSAVIFVGTKGTGQCWYGFADGTVWPDEEPFPPIPDPPNNERGWWSTGFQGQIIFYDPDDLQAVARGEMEPYEPQPYATFNIDSYLFNVLSNQQKHHVGAVSFDAEGGLLYVFEPFADGDKPIIHVWQINDSATYHVYPGSSIQTAIDHSDSGGSIVVHDDNGVACNYQESLMVNKKLSIIAQGIVTVNGSLNPSSPVFMVNSSGSGTTIEGFIITGGSSGVKLENTTNCLLLNNNITENSFAGIYLYGSSHNNMTQNNITSNLYGVFSEYGDSNTITDNQITQNPYAGVVLRYWSDQNQVTGNTLNHNGYGLHLLYSSLNTIKKNQIQNNNFYGTYIDNSQNNYLENNNINGNPYAGIALYFGSNNNTFMDNTVTGNGFGTYIYQSNLNNLTDNNISDNSFYGIYFDNADSNTLKANTINNNPYAGIALYFTSENNTIGSADKGNTINGNGFGMYFYTSNQNNVTDNDLDNTYYGLYLDNSDSNTINLNNISGNPYAGIALCFASDANTIFQNNLTGNGFGMYIHQSIGGSTHPQGDISGNNITSNLFYGLYISQSAGIKINNNTINSNPYAGIVLKIASSNNQLQYNNLEGNGFALYIDTSTGNSINRNNFYTHTGFAYDNGTNNWDNRVDTGNYYADWPTTTPRSIPGGSNMDQYPKITPFSPGT